MDERIATYTEKDKWIMELKHIRKLHRGNGTGWLSNGDRIKDRGQWGRKYKLRIIL